MKGFIEFKTTLTKAEAHLKALAALGNVATVEVIVTFEDKPKAPPMSVWAIGVKGAPSEIEVTREIRELSGCLLKEAHGLTRQLKNGITAYLYQTTDPHLPETKHLILEAR